MMILFLNTKLGFQSLGPLPIPVSICSLFSTDESRLYHVHIENVKNSLANFYLFLQNRSSNSFWSHISSKEFSSRIVQRKITKRLPWHFSNLKNRFLIFHKHTSSIYGLTKKLTSGYFHVNTLFYKSAIGDESLTTAVQNISFSSFSKRWDSTQFKTHEVTNMLLCSQKFGHTRAANTLSKQQLATSKLSTLWTNWSLISCSRDEFLNSLT